MRSTRVEVKEMVFLDGFYDERHRPLTISQHSQPKATFARNFIRSAPFEDFSRAFSNIRQSSKT